MDSEEGKESAEKGTAARKLIPLSALDVTRDVLDIDFQLSSDNDPSDIKYFLEITSWELEEMKVQVNFSDPLMISRGVKPDRVII